MEKLHTYDFFDGAGYDVVVVGSGYGGSIAACRLSVAGFKVCLFEKGRKWEAKDFPTDSFNILSAVRLENMNMGINIGPKDALFQVHIQDDSLAAVACGLGGGSLVNAGVMLPTTVRTRRDPKWPEPWEKDWDRYEAFASEMLKVQSLPTVFQNSNIMQQVVDKEYDNNIHEQVKLSINFDMEESRKSQQQVNCLACGNCLAGCPYNAKNSTDKTYLVSAIEAGCTIKTESEVQYVVRNDDYIYKEEGGFKARSRRRWLVFLNEFDYVASDIVILSAGVFGTAKILFQSRLRGLSTSEKLGSGLSCNGNNVAYLAGSSAPLNALGLKETQFSGLPFQERPGPSISSSYTSSLGFTIQSAVIPTAYPRFLFKGITTYRWRSSNRFLHDMINILKHVVGLKRGEEMVLNAMGYDDSSGELTFDKDSNRIRFQPPHDPLLPRKIEAFQKLARKLGGMLFMSRYRSTSVHLLGGCIASSDASSGVCNLDGQVFDGTSPKGVHAGLYLCDASIIPCSVGINPSLTIAAAAEHVSRKLVQNGAKKYIQDFSERGLNSKIKMEVSRDSEVVAKETMRGQVGGMPCTAYLKLRFKPARAGKFNSLLQGEVVGHIICKSVEMDKMYIIHGEVELCTTNRRTPYTQYMRYHLLLAASSGSRYVLEGRKVMNPYFLALYAWRESTTLDVKLRKINDQTGEKTMNIKGKLHISALELLKSACTLEGRSRIEFVSLLTRSLIRTYILQLPRASHISFTPSDFAQRPYPNSKMHEIKTEDGCIICCQQWQSHHSRELNRARKHYPILLLNGYSTESFCLPTETNDLVRTFLQGGHDVLLLRTRLHPLNASNDFSIEDVGRIDIPAAMRKITELYEEFIKVHVVAHCVGGLAIHISIMGGHVSAKHIASLSCTNSSMFFKLTTSASIKMWLPLIPISMGIMGKNKTLHLLQKPTTSIRQRLVKSIARLIPRHERCSCDECEVFSGIFGNTFWHENVSHVTHQWMNKENQTKLPMAAFSHLRKICNAGFIVDIRGSNAYLIHPERMALPTLYVSGERVLLVTPETSFLAHKYMKLHQPGYRHERVVVDGFGHSDLLIGEKSHQEVFPHIQKHVELAEDEQDSLRMKSRNYEALAWSDDPYKEGAGFGSCISPLIINIIILLLFVLLFKLFSLSGFSLS
ncbi:uncharacterized protein LOC130996680 [Salvia miltiorrhiza]|uniref:uncharacterized protein LOC130996680 n=1 Tax=Salvia miltiorrhiza TaxID=226208 RepID=UPI0025AD8E68|nr:uncharacterized protein LOC130996680 [Salvia miltiorrhiza]